MLQPAATEARNIRWWCWSIAAPASASRNCRWTIQDHDRGLIAGEVTFGKGLVQTVYPSQKIPAWPNHRQVLHSQRTLIQRDYSNSLSMTILQSEGKTITLTTK